MFEMTISSSHDSIAVAKSVCEESTFVRMAATQRSVLITQFNRSMEDIPSTKSAPVDTVDSRTSPMKSNSTGVDKIGSFSQGDWSQNHSQAYKKRVVSAPAYTLTSSHTENDNFSFTTSPPIRVTNKLQKTHTSLDVPQYTGSILSPVSQNIVNQEYSKSYKSTISAHEVPIIRSNGKIDSLCSFPVNKFNATLYEAEDHELDLGVDNEEASSGSFEIPSGESPQSVYSPFFEQPRSISNSNEPKFPTGANGISPVSNIRSSLMSQPTLFSVNSFQDFMEERLIRWRPNDSQHNTNSVLDGSHPYTEQHYGKKPSKKSGALNIFNWFGTKSTDTDLEKQGPETFYTAQLTSHHRESEVLEETNDLESALRSVSMNAKKNSSNSILPRTLSRVAHSNSAVLLDSETNGISTDNLDSNLQQSGSSTIGPTYTPNAIPFSDFELNFNTRNGDPTDGNAHNMFDTFGNEFLELINGNDNFITSCFNIFKC